MRPVGIPEYDHTVLPPVVCRTRAPHQRHIDDAPAPSHKALLPQLAAPFFKPLLRQLPLHALILSRRRRPIVKALERRAIRRLAVKPDAPKPSNAQLGQKKLFRFRDRSVTPSLNQQQLDRDPQGIARTAHRRRIRLPHTAASGPEASTPSTCSRSSSHFISSGRNGFAKSLSASSRRPVSDRTRHFPPPATRELHPTEAGSLRRGLSNHTPIRIPSN